MTNYNDGNWHGWNGGECPVHPETEVEIRLAVVAASPWDGAVKKGKEVQWGHDEDHLDVIAFRVVKEHKEPREFWLATRWSGDERRVLDAEPDYDGYYCDVIHVREVME